MFICGGRASLYKPILQGWIMHITTSTKCTSQLRATLHCVVTTNPTISTMKIVVHTFDRAEKHM